MSTGTETLFDTFNARALNPAQIARTFVPSAQFSRLCNRAHTIVLGPRGSGKTTLLKMLQPAALADWQHPDADAIRGKVDFTGVFIATDISWGEQLAALGSGALDADARRLLSLASFTTHVLRSLITAVQQRRGNDISEPLVHRSIILDPADEAAVVVKISQAWHVKEIVPSLTALRQAMTQRLLLVREIASREAIMGGHGRSARLGSTEFLHLHFLRSASYAIEVLEDAIGISGNKWALLFDELELAPEWIQDELVKSLRSTDDRFLFKLAFNPFTATTQLMQTATSPAPGQDFDQIALWYAEKRDSYAFCTGLWDELLQQQKYPLTPARKVLGRSYFESLPDELKSFGTAYRPGSRWSNRFVSLAKKDRTFRDFLDEKGIDPLRMDNMTHTERAAEVRKIAPIVAVREFFRRADTEGRDEGGRLRSRKSAILYAGADSVFAVTEGNPRWFIGLATRLLERSDTHSLGVHPLIQAEELTKTAQRFLATLRTIPIQRVEGFKPISLIQIIRQMGRYFHYQTVRGPFRPEPPGSFTVDSNTPENILAALGQALNAGAIVYVPDDEGQLILTSLRGKRFRLSYLLAPVYGFPIRLGKAVALSTILNWEDTTFQQLHLDTPDDN